MSLLLGSDPRGATQRGRRGQPDAARRLKRWTRDRFTLAEDDLVVVRESATTIPGCPPRETQVAFWTDGRRHEFRLFKGVEEIVEDDLPPAWLKESLAACDGVGCECC